MGRVQMVWEGCGSLGGDWGMGGRIGKDVKVLREV